MGKSSVPKGCTKRENCEGCGRKYYAIYTPGGKKVKLCSICNPDAYKTKKEKYGK